jgi:hypothetical protein
MVQVFEFAKRRRNDSIKTSFASERLENKFHLVLPKSINPLNIRSALTC